MFKYGVLIFAILINFISLFVNDARSWEFSVSVLWIALLSLLCFLNVYMDRNDKNG